MAGISFYINNEKLVLNPGQKISISIDSILLTEKTLTGAISLPFDIPNNSYNREILKISSTLMTFEEYQEAPCNVYLGGNFWKGGYIYINRHDSKNINILYTEINSDEQFNNNLLKVIDLPLITRLPSQSPETNIINEAIRERANNIYPNDEKDFICPTIYNIQAGEHLKPLYPVTFSSDETNLVERNTNYFQNLYENGNYFIYSGVEQEYLTESYRNRNFISPFFYVNYILKHLFKKLNFTLAKNKLEESDLQNLIVYNTKGFIYASHEEYFTTDRPPFILVPRGTINESIRFFKLSDFLPDIIFSDFLASIKTTANLIYLFNYTDKTVNIVCKNDLIKSFKIIDISEISSPYESYEYQKAPKQPYGVFYAKKDDAILESHFKLDGYFYKGWVSSFANLPSQNNSYFDYYVVNQTINLKDYYPIYFWAENNTWQQLNVDVYSNIRPYDVNIEKEQKEQSKIQILADTSVVRINTRKWIWHLDFSYEWKTHYYCPAIDAPLQNEKHNSNQFAANVSKPNISSVHLLFYRGKVNNSWGDPYPFANRNRFLPTHISPEGEVTGFTKNGTEHSLEIDGPDGLFEKFYKNWFSFTKSLTNLATYNIRFSAAQILNDDVFINTLQINGKRFIISKLTITADVNKIYPCKTEMYQIEPK